MKKKGFSLKLAGVISVLLLFWGCASTNTVNYRSVAQGIWFKAFKANNYDESKTIEEHSYLIIIEEFNSISELNDQSIIIGKEDGLTVNEIAVLQSGRHKLKVKRTFDYQMEFSALGDKNQTYYETEIYFNFQPGRIYQLTASMKWEEQLNIRNPHVYIFDIKELSSENYDPKRDNFTVKDTTPGRVLVSDNLIPGYSIVDGVNVAIRRDLE